VNDDVEALACESFVPVAFDVASHRQPVPGLGLVSLVSFGVSGIYLSFLMTVIGSMVARSCGWVPEGRFQLGRWAWPVSIAGAVYLALMLVNVVAPTGLASPRAFFNLDWSRCSSSS
jgi:amino acid transporter